MVFGFVSRRVLLNESNNHFFFVGPPSDLSKALAPPARPPYRRPAYLPENGGAVFRGDRM